MNFSQSDLYVAAGVVLGIFAWRKIEPTVSTVF